MFTKNGGSRFSKDQPFLRTESTFNKKFKMDKLVKMVFGSEHQTKWDETLLSSAFTPLGDRKHMTMGFVHCAHKKQYSFQSRDFVEKTFNFYHNGKFYRYSSSLPDELGQERFPVAEETTRGFTYYNFGIVERNPKDDKIKA